MIVIVYTRLNLGLNIRRILFLHLYYNNIGCPELTDSFALFVAVVELASVAFCQSDQVAARAPAR